MRATTLVLVLVLAAPLATGATSVSNSATGAFVLQEWDIFNLWNNATQNVALTVSWASSATYAAEDLSITIYKPGVLDQKCPPSRGTCTFVQHPNDVYAQSVGCPPLNSLDAKEGGTLLNMPAGRYHVVVEGNLGWSVPYTLSTDVASLTYNETTRFAVVAYVPPC